jgi:hypothetical protein
MAPGRMEEAARAVRESRAAALSRERGGEDEAAFLP